MSACGVVVVDMEWRLRHLRLRFGRASWRLALALAALTLVSLVRASDSRAQARVDRNVVYGMFSGLALLMDVHRPDTPNGYGVIFVAAAGGRRPSPTAPAA